MKSETDRRFWHCFRSLPTEVQRTAREKYRLWLADPSHPSLQYKQLLPPLVSVRINRSYRAVGRRDGDTVLWFWIGKHSEYEQVIA